MDDIMNKESFAAFIQQKRRASGMTQEELAGKLYVSGSTVSKWERGLSYPDISLVPAICRELAITEHEFFTACDDIQARRERRDAWHWRHMVRGWTAFLTVSYGIAAVTCFICNLAIARRLDWFFIVLASLALAYSLTCLPILLRREKAAVSLSAATLCLLLLILACGLYTGGGWLAAGLSITAVCLTLPWGLYALCRFCGRQLLLLGLGILTLWTFALLAVIWAVTGDGRLFRMGFPIAAYSYAYVWGIFAVLRFAPINGWFKAAAVTAIAALAVPFSDGFSALLGADPSIPFSAYFDWSGGLLYRAGDWVMGGRAVFAGLLLLALLLCAAGGIAALLRGRAKSKGKEEQL